MPARVVRHGAAVQDLAEVYAHLGAESRRVAERWVDAVEITIRLLLEHPHAGRLRAVGTARTRVRSWSVSGFPAYLVFYRVETDALGILRLLHGARDLPSLLGDS